MRLSSLLIFVFLIIVSCKDIRQREPKAGSTDTAVATEKIHSVQIPEEPTIVDTGQTWFKVNITRNDTPYLDYEGSWPVFFLSNNSATLQLSKSKNIMGITDIITIYMNGMPSCNVPIVLSNRDKGTASMILSPVTDGAYGLPVSPTEGFLTITKNVDSIVSGTFEGKGIDLNNDVFLFKGYFLNAKINPTKL